MPDTATFLLEDVYQIFRGMSPGVQHHVPLRQEPSRTELSQLTSRIYQWRQENGQPGRVTLRRDGMTLYITCDVPHERQ